MQFLPWVRRGLAAELGNTDAGAGLPTHAAFSVSVRVNGQAANVDIETYGPGDVTGLDPLAISRVAPRRDATNVAPDEFACVEFDEPDLPWMFTPASAGATHRLRPWLVLIVVERRDGVSIGVDQSKPLPVLTIAAPAVPADELPDLAQSWAWAHAQVVTAATTDSAAAALDGAPGQSLSRLMCPRRLVPNRQYLAALVPAFDLGVAAGLAVAPDPAITSASPAWDRGALGASIRLPVYYHWDFSTGPPGDFESLARELTPTFVPDGVGEIPMYVGDAHPALPAVAVDAGGIVTMQGALRAPGSGGGNLSGNLAAWVTKLTEVVDATATAATDGSTADAEAVAPPIYGEWFVNVHRVPAAGSGRPRWLRDLNADPRHRAAAGVGAEVVRANQEEYVDAAWRQVGDVIAANRLLDVGRAVAAIADRVHQRHVVGIDAVRAMAFAERAGVRLPFKGASLAAAIERSPTLPGFNSRSFRRLASPRSAPLRLATRRVHAGLTGTAGADVASLVAVARGDLAARVSQGPDGVRATTLTSLAGRLMAQGAPRLDTKLVEKLRGTVSETAQRLDGPARPLRVRPDLAKVGVLTDAHLDAIRLTARLGEDIFARIADLRVDVGAAAGGGVVIGVIVGPEGMTPVTASPDGTIVAVGGGLTVDLTRHIADRLAPVAPDLTITGRGRITAPVLDRGLTGPAARAAPMAPSAPTAPIRRVPLGGAGVPAIAHVPGPATVGPVLPALVDARRLLTDPTVALAGLTAVVESVATLATIGDLARHLGLKPVRGGAVATAGNVVVIPPPADPRHAFAVFVEAVGDRAHHVASFVEAIPPPTVYEPLDVEAVRDAIVRESRPRPMIEGRIAARLRAGDAALTAGQIGRITVLQPEPLAPVMVGPVLDRPLYLDLAAYDPNRFLPGAGDIPDDSITVVETNPRFVEAFMVGVNHEFNRELLWRRYPTDRRGTAFRKFWDRLDDADDIEPIHQWVGANRLGSNSAADADGNLVLLVRGQLLRRYPNTVIYAAKATPQRRIDPAAAPLAPIFAGFLDPDIAYVGFGFDAATAKAGNGTLFVLQEQPAEPRFGLDVPAGALPAAPTSPPASWSALTWGHLAVAPGGFLDVTAFGGAPERPLADTGPAVGARFGADAAHMAAITFQRPFRAAVHSSEVLR